MRRILSSFFSWLEDEDYIVKSPVRRIHKVKTGKTVKRYVGYKNGFSLNEDLRDAKGWSVAQIDSRTEKMVDQTMALFPR